MSKSIAWRLALAIALTCALVMSLIGVFLYRSLASELAWRDDQALLGRLEQVRALLHDSDSLEALQERPRLYQNMLGNLDSVLLVKREDGSPLIAINPHQQALPDVPPIAQARAPQRTDIKTVGATVLLAGMAQGPAGETLSVTVGKRLDEREQMLASYRIRLYGAVGFGALMAFGLGLLLLRRGLTPLRDLARAMAGIDPRSLDQRMSADHVPAELKEPVQALNAMLARLEDSFARLSQFSADLAHEIRTPLHNLLGSNSLALNQSRSAAEYQEVLASNIEEYERLNRMAENLMFLARAEHGQRPLQLHVLDLGEVGEGLCDYFEALAEDRQLRLYNQLSGPLTADLQLLQRALGNLLANAVRHAQTGSTVRLLRHDDAEYGWIGVHNLGPAIDPQHIDKLFDRFYRVDPSRAQPGDSGGLGLAIVHSIMHLHGGQVRVVSNDSGTLFELGFARNPPTFPRSGVDTVPAQSSARTQT
ncbi:two-component system, OmpR family, heavy metal sensor histidine kinase CusS [Pseudomonas taetrolens]|uniref:Sensor protein n=1 Tax=Pseudomonas taetrolens TaxID=47884 RepID=A0A1H5CRL1_PSETA|nr:heavy metal sensor histidine kinase [Pseudomonas taetrolens]SED69098.1 two-component system, OmpR family, heavy metal sensor histidine kinase CusS [Pseudomonas taetrolens]SQF88475.1 heavy metal sensor signal transduction histidine kinase [Pseudomonas taetrolens]VEH51664.1 heavy metal sensor signal transduction histidine kinase [Pseudomonas taetrolens]